MISLVSLIAVLGLLCIIVGTFLISSQMPTRKKYIYPLLIAGGIGLLIYSIYLKDIIFIILQGVFILSAIAGLFRMNKIVLKRGVKNNGEKNENL